MKDRNGYQRRAPRGYTYDPCPGGCGRDLYPEARPTNSVCSKCASILRNHKQRVEERERAGDHAPRLYRVPSRSHWLPYLPERGVSESPIQKGFHSLMMAVSEHEDEPRFGARDDLPVIFEDEKQSYRRSSTDAERLFAPAAASALGALFVAVRDGLAAAYADGKEDGRSLLIGLNDGSLSLKDFEQRRS